MAGTYTSFPAILNKLFKGTTLTQPATWYLALSTTTPAIDGTNFTEPVAMAYARVAIPNDGSNWSVATTTSLVNLLDVTFTESTGAWGTITYVGLYDASTSGNLWFYDILTPSRAVASGTTIKFVAGAITISMANS
jgi:hypothetical protein